MSTLGVVQLGTEIDAVQSAGVHGTLVVWFMVGSAIAAKTVLDILIGDSLASDDLSGRVDLGDSLLVWEQGPHLCHCWHQFLDHLNGHNDKWGCMPCGSASLLKGANQSLSWVCVSLSWGVIQFESKVVLDWIHQRLVLLIT